MADEATKTSRVRGEEFFQKYLVGRVIDIGCGPDPITPDAEPFDLAHGDAQFVADLRPNAVYDAVCSSHCLEHMRDVPQALIQWWRLVKPGGYLILVVPDENLYEQGTWPSLFNLDHKATFRIGGASSWSPVSYDICQLVAGLPGAEILQCELQDQGYDYAKRRVRIGSMGRISFTFRRRTISGLRRFGSPGKRLADFAGRMYDRLGAPVDQTMGLALAQIQVIAQKRP